MPPSSDEANFPAISNTLDAHCAAKTRTAGGLTRVKTVLRSGGIDRGHRTSSKEVVYR